MSEFEDLTNLRRVAEDALWAAQLLWWPDSRRMTLAEVYGWAASVDSKKLEADVDRWVRSYGRLESSLSSAKPHFINHRISERRYERAWLILAALRYPAFVFYESGKQPDGGYAHMGCRFGVGQSEYVSGFSDL